MTPRAADGTGDVVVRVRGLTTRFGPQVVHQDLDLDVRRGEVMGVVGGSGTGKSVLLRAILGLVPAEAESIEVLGHDVRHASDGDLRDLQRRWGVLFQDGALWSSLTVTENVEVPLQEHAALPAALRRDVAALKIGLVGLQADAAFKMPSELSGGMRKRAGLARALALDPELLFLDEPTSGLDPIGANEFDLLIRRLQQSLGLTVFMVTHDLDSLRTICDRIAVLADRRILAVGTFDEMLQQEHPWIREYFRGPRGRAALAEARG